MGFEAPRTVFGLTFEDPKYAGLEVRVRSLPVGDFEVIAGIEPVASGDTNKAALGRLRRALRLLAANLESWNLTENGTPVPAKFAACRASGLPVEPPGRCREHEADGEEGCAYTGIYGQEPDFLTDVLAAWAEAIASVAPPLPQGSPNGGTPSPQAAAEESLGLATSSQSLPG